VDLAIANVIQATLKMLLLLLMMMMMMNSNSKNTFASCARTKQAVRPVVGQLHDAPPLQSAT